MRQRDVQDLLCGRINIVGYLIVAALGILIAGFWNFQLVQSAHYRERAENNRIKQIPLIAPRGKILDRYGKILVDNRPSYNVVLIRENSTRPVEETIAFLAPGLSVTASELLSIVDKRKKEPLFRPIVLKEDIGVSDIAFVRAHQLEMPEISVEFQPRRKYLEGALAAHAIGYLGQVTEAELRDKKDLYTSGDEIGKSGIERTYDTILRGVDGYRRVVVNKSQREVERLGEELAKPGNDLRTTLDLDLQRAAEEAIGDQVGAAFAVDPRTGEILVLASKPAYDPNLFATRISQTDYAALLNDPNNPFRNRVVQDAHSPGSVFKIFMAAAGLEDGTIDPLDHMDCSGSAVFYDRSFACWKKGGHGHVGLHEAIVDSCNVFFYNVGKALGIEKIARYMNAMGLGHTTGIDIPNEIPGLIPSIEWKRRVRKEDWYPGETISVAIGQGAVTVTPLQVTVAMGGLASGGRVYQPHFVKPKTIEDLGFEAPEIGTQEFSVRQSTVDIITRAMWGVVNEGGTGTRAAVPGFDVAGKTGTAQVVGMKSYGKGQQFEDNAWFVGFAPYRNPEIAVGVFIEHGGHGGSTAAPVAHAIFEAYYKKKTGQYPATAPAVASLVR
jgi:penicillin-binding protein 2